MSDAFFVLSIIAIAICILCLALPHAQDTDRHSKCYYHENGIPNWYMDKALAGKVTKQDDAMLDKELRRGAPSAPTQDGSDSDNNFGYKPGIGLSSSGVGIGLGGPIGIDMDGNATIMFPR